MSPERSHGIVRTGTDVAGDPRRGLCIFVGHPRRSNDKLGASSSCDKKNASLADTVHGPISQVLISYPTCVPNLPRIYRQKSNHIALFSNARVFKRFWKRRILQLIVAAQDPSCQHSLRHSANILPSSSALHRIISKFSAEYLFH